MQAGLADWFTISHRRYRGPLAQLLFAGTIGSVLAYLDNFILTGLTDALSEAFSAAARGSDALAPAAPAADAGASAPFAPVAAWVGLSLPVTIVGLFVLGRLASAAVAFWRARVGGLLRIRSRNDLEAEVLVHLLRKDDAFFSAHSPAETVNRLAVDVFRVSERRPNLMTIWWSALLIIGSVSFFAVRDWRLALVALAACAGGALWTYRITRNVSSYDREYLSQDDRVKSQFEDMLRAASEIQVRDLFAHARARFEARQTGRTELYGRYVSLRAMLQVANIVSALVAFAAMIGILLWLSGGGQGRAALVLVPAVIWALPRLFDSAAELIFIRLDFQLARTSMERLLQYETPEEMAEQGPNEPAPSAAAGPRGARRRRTAKGESDGVDASEGGDLRLEVDGVSFQYVGPDGSRQGGVSGVETHFDPGRWTAIVGGAGSGKSTLLKLLLGRLQPLEGAVRYRGKALGAMSRSELAGVLSLMPQSPALLSSTIADNVLFASTAPRARDRTGSRAGKRIRPNASAHSAPTQAELGESDLEVLERAGLARVCRLKALDMQPGAAAEEVPLPAPIEEIRQRARERLASCGSCGIRPYEEDGFDEQQWWCESLLRGRADRTAAAKALLGPKADGRPLRPLVETAIARALLAAGRRVLADSRHLLRLPSYQRYAGLAAVPISELVWQLRSSSAHLADVDPTTEADQAALLAVALTSTPVECTDRDVVDELRARLRGHQDDATARLRGLLGEDWSAFSLCRVHPRLSWRENLLFGAVEAANSRALRQADGQLLELVEADDLRETFTRIGLGFDVGRKGGNLSGGQGQLVALCRALLPRTAILVLDEPTSALDPASRSRVAELLRDWRKDRIVITVSHDPELVRHADEVRLMEGGRLVASGTFDDLASSSEAFQTIMRHS